MSGRRCAPVDTLGDPILNPSPRTGRLLAEVPCSGPKAVDQAVGAARDAFPAWRKVGKNF